ncbi:3TM-type holin [Burkholderia sp. BCC1998]|uniref:3TM-type holin n=1 Tax=Burkholderia sp. BCC1998 TaxID=2817447 RepID=UPI002AB7A9B1|nr:3TM-type holin [Burkholderia sp. BCC1998]
MAVDPITAVSDLATSIVQRIWPDKTQQEQQQLAAVLAMVQGQLQINQAEAASPSPFTSGWRPYIGWVCGTGCAWNWIGLPIANFLASAIGHPINVAPADLTQMLPLLMGMLGMSVTHAWENVKVSQR